jgi:hypothetical protein
VDEGLGVVKEHEESTGGGGRGVVPGRVLGGSWKAGRSRRRVPEATKRMYAHAAGAVGASRPRS